MIAAKKTACTTTTERKSSRKLFWPQPRSTTDVFLCSPDIFRQGKVTHRSKVVFAFFFPVTVLLIFSLSNACWSACGCDWGGKFIHPHPPTLGNTRRGGKKTKKNRSVGGDIISSFSDVVLRIPVHPAIQAVRAASPGSASDK